MPMLLAALLALGAVAGQAPRPLADGVAALNDGRADEANGVNLRVGV